MSVGSTIKIAILGEARGIKDAANEAGKALGEVDAKSKSTGQKLAGYGKAAAAGIATVAVAAGAYAVKVGGELQTAQDDLANALHDAGSSISKYGAGLKPLLSDNEKWGYSNAQVYDSLSALARAGITGKNALKEEALAANIAKAKHLDLNAATLLVTKASEGQSKALKSLGIDANIAAGGARKVELAHRALTAAEATLKDAEVGLGDAQDAANEYLADANKKGVTAAQKSALQAKAAGILEAAQKKVTVAQKGVTKAQLTLNETQKSGAQITDLLSKRFGGAAADSAKTFQGKILAAKTELNDMAAKIGLKLIPILEDLVKKVMGVVDWFSKHKAITIALAAVIGGIVTTLIAYAAVTKAIEIAQTLATVATGVWSAAQVVFNAVMAANPIILTVAAILLLGAAIYEAYKHFGPFHNAVDAAWQILQTGFHWVQDNWPKLLAILTGPIGVAVYVIASHWTAIKNGAADAFNTVVDFVKGLPGRLIGYASAVGGAGVRLGAALLSGLVSGVEGVLGKVADIGKAIANGAIRFINIILGDVRTAIRDLANVLANVNIPGVGRVYDAASSALNGVANRIPNIPSFGGGGIVPGTPGSPQLILAHAGENVQTQAQQQASGGGGGGPVHLTFNIYEVSDPMATVTALRTFLRREGIKLA